MHSMVLSYRKRNAYFKKFLMKLIFQEWGKVRSLMSKERQPLLSTVKAMKTV